MSDASAPGDVLSPPPDLPVSARTAEILRGIADAELRAQIRDTVAYAMGALEDLQCIHLPPDDFEEPPAGPGPAARDHIALIPYVLAAVGSLNALVAYVMQTFPYVPPPDGINPNDPHFDLTFDLVEGKRPVERAADRLRDPNMPVAAIVADNVHTVAAVLRGAVVSFGDRLQFALGQNEAWPLLAELDDYKNRLIKSVQTLIFAALEAFAPEAPREEILPAYRSTIAEAVDVRSALCDLSYHVRRFCAAMAKTPGDDVVPLLVALADHLARFCAKAAYRNLRAEDKKAVIDFRRHLHEMRRAPGVIPLRRLRHAVEGFAAFLDAMHAINLREMLVAHDRQSLGEAVERLDEAQRWDDPVRAGRELRAVVADLAVVQGRSPDLDDARRHFSEAGFEELARDIPQWRTLLEATITHLS